MTPFIAIAS